MANMSARNVWRMKMSDESEKCGRVGCRKKVKMLDAWAIRDGLKRNLLIGLETVKESESKIGDLLCQ